MKDAQNIFSTIKKDDFKELLQIAKIHKTDIDVDLLVNDFFGENKLLPKLYERWYKSLEQGDCDYGVYNDDVYLTELFNCWKYCTRRTIKDFYKIVDKFPNYFTNINTVLDLGCGLAHTTVALSNLFRDAQIIGTNLGNTLQYKVCEDVCSNYDRCSMIPEERTLHLSTSVDLICAFEFFEHLRQPLNLLYSLLEAYNPRIIICANAFTTKSLGHFNSYYVDNKILSGKDTNKLFNSVLKDSGYTHINTGIFMDVPKVWIKE